MILPSSSAWPLRADPGRAAHDVVAADPDPALDVEAERVAEREQEVAVDRRDLHAGDARPGADAEPAADAHPRRAARLEALDLERDGDALQVHRALVERHVDVVDLAVEALEAGDLREREVAGRAPTAVGVGSVISPPPAQRRFSPS